MKKNELRDCQKKGFDLAIKHLSKNKTFRFNMTTGSGKTVLAIKTADEIFKDGCKIVSVHTINLKKQFEFEIKKHSINSKLWVVNTYQSLKNIKTKCDILIVDEVHQGGQESEGCYKKIINNLKPKKIISLSATDYNVDDKLFGKEKYCYGLEEASKDKIINECDIITIDTGLNQILSSKEKISKEKLSHIYDENIKREVDLKFKKSLDAIYSNNVKSALEVYLKNEKGNQAILFVHNIEWCEKAHLIANELGITNKFIHSNIKSKEVASNINKFKNKDFNILISIRQLREGFDFPDLEVAIDCAPSFTNEGRDFKQKIGRILRNPFGKKRSRYYIINCVNKFSSDLDIHDSLIANIEVTSRNDLRINKLTNREILLPIGEIKDNTKTYRLFVEHTDCFKENGRKCLFELVNKKDDSASKKQILLNMAKIGDKKPQIKTSIGKRFYSYIHKNSRCFDSLFLEKIKNINPKWLPVSMHDVSKKRKEFLINYAKEGKDLYLLDQKIRNTFRNGTNKKNPSYDHSFFLIMKKIAKKWFTESPQKNKTISSKIKNTHRKTCKNKIFGVDYVKSKKLWRARLNLNKVAVYTELFKTKKEAIKARKEAEKKYWK